MARIADPGTGSALEAFAQGQEQPPEGGGRGPSASGPGQGADRMQIIESVRNFSKTVEQSAQQLAEQFPPFQPIVQQFLQQLKQVSKKMVVEAGQGGANQNASAQKLPMGG